MFGYCVRVSFEGDWCLISLHPLCRIAVSDDVKLTVVERYQSNRLFGYMVVAFRLMQERKYVCGKQPKIVNLQQVGLYSDFLSQHEQSAVNMLGSMLKQLARRGGVPEQIREAFRKAKKEFGGRGLLLPGMVDILKETIASLPGLFICIDALDECIPKHRRDLLESLREIVAVSPNIRIFLTWRPHIEKEIMKYFSQAVLIHLSPSAGDIKSYLEMRLDRDTDPDAMDEGLRADIMRIIPEKISEM